MKDSDLFFQYTLQSLINQMLVASPDTFDIVMKKAFTGSDIQVSVGSKVSPLSCIKFSSKNLLDQNKVTTLETSSLLANSHSQDSRSTTLVDEVNTDKNFESLYLEDTNMMHDDTLMAGFQESNDRSDFAPSSPNKIDAPPPRNEPLNTNGSLYSTESLIVIESSDDETDEGTPTIITAKKPTRKAPQTSSMSVAPTTPTRFLLNLHYTHNDNLSEGASSAGSSNCRLQTAMERTGGKEPRKSEPISTKSSTNVSQNIMNETNESQIRNRTVATARESTEEKAPRKSASTTPIASSNNTQQDMNNETHLINRKRGRPRKNPLAKSSEAGKTARRK